ncbi:MAG: lipopolysaccharide kinase InaA family protein [Pseudomonadales bacterium]
MASLNSQALIAAGRQLGAPFEVQLKLAGEVQTARCVELLRLVPGRRVVVKLLLGEKTYLGKIFLGSDGKKYCQRERKGIEALEGAGISTAQFEGHGCLQDNGAEILLLEYLPQVQHLSECLALSPADAKTQLEAVIKMITMMHGKGLVHKDCHLDNFLVNEQGLYLIDGDAVEQSSALSQRDALDNLALFFVQLPLSFTSRLAGFFTHYCELRAWSLADYLPAFQQALQAQRDNRQRRFLKKVFRDCTQFKVTKSWSRFIAQDRQADCPELQALIANPDHYIEAGRLLKDGNSATVAKVSVGDKVYVVKRYNLKSVTHWLTRFWRASRAWASWHNAQLLCFYSVCTPKPLAMIEQRCGALRGKAYFITEHCDAKSALDVAGKVKESPEALEALAKQFGRLFEVMKLLRISHGDFKATNFLVADDGLTVIDLDSMQLHASPQEHQKAFAKDHQRFMKNWRSEARVEAVMAKAIAGQ